LAGGRNTKLTEDVQNELARLIGAGVYMRQACEYVGLSEQTIYNWMARGSTEILRLEANPKSKPLAKEAPYVEFFKKIKKAENASEVRAVIHWQEEIKGDWRAAKDFLARRFPDRWSPRLEVTGADGAPVQVNMNVDVVTLEQKVLAVLEMRNGNALSGSDTVIESE
jgi:transposase